MATTTWDDMVPSLAPFVGGAPDVTMRDALQASATNFLAQTHLWRDEFYPFETEAGVHTYELYAEAAIEMVEWVKISNTELGHTDVRGVDKNRIDDDGRPTSFWVVEDRKIRLFPVPDEVYTVSGGVVLKPTKRSRGVDDWVASVWQDAIVSGAIYRLTQIPNKGWSDFQLAQYHKQLHDRAIANAKVRNYQGVNLRVRMRGV